MGIPDNVVEFDTFNAVVLFVYNAVFPVSLGQLLNGSPAVLFNNTPLFKYIAAKFPHELNEPPYRVVDPKTAAHINELHPMNEFVLTELTEEGIVIEVIPAFSNE